MSTELGNSHQASPGGGAVGVAQKLGVATFNYPKGSTDKRGKQTKFSKQPESREHK